MPHFDSTGGVRVAAYDFGGDGPPILFAHATGFHAHVWTPLIGHLRDHFHCYAFDSRAHGDAITPPEADFAWAGLGDDALAALDGLGLERPFGVGHSAGGAALLLAEADRGGTFRALYCYEPVVPPTDVPLPAGDNPLAIGALKRRAVFPSTDAAYEQYSSRGPFTVLRPDTLRAYVDHGFAPTSDGEGGVRLKCKPEDESRMYQKSLAHDAFSKFPTIACPVTVAYGSETDAIGERLVAAQAERLPQAHAEELPGLGHFGPLQDPAAVAESIIRAFTGH